MTIVRIAITVVALLSFGLAASAESGSPLTGKKIKGFLNSLDEVERLGNKYGKDESKRAKAEANARQRAASMGDVSAMMPTEQDMKRAASPLTSSLGEIRESGGADEMLATVKKHGFSSIEEWANVGDRSFRAYAAHRMAAERPNMDKQMAEARESLKNSGMSAAQQEAMMKMMGGAGEMMKAFDDVPAADKKAIKPYLKDFEALEKR